MKVQVQINRHRNVLLYITEDGKPGGIVMRDTFQKPTDYVVRKLLKQFPEDTVYRISHIEGEMTGLEKFLQYGRDRELATHLIQEGANLEGAVVNRYLLEMEYDGTQATLPLSSNGQ